MKIQVLIAALCKEPIALLNEMGIKSDAIIGNQCSEDNVESFDYTGNKIVVYSFNERGVGLNRNNTLLRARGDVAVLADDDMYFYENYEETLNKAYEKYPEADVIIFNIEGGSKKRFKIMKKMNINYWNVLRFGAARITFRISSIKNNGIFFNTEFGGGTSHSAGEDSLFLLDCLKKKLKIIALPETLACLGDEEVSSWFEGYTEKYFFDKGCFYGVAFKQFACIYAFLELIKNRKRYKEFGSINKALHSVMQGIKCIRKQ